MIRYSSFTLFVIIMAFISLTPACAKVVNGDITFTRYDKEFNGLSLYTIHPDGTQLQRFLRGANGPE